MTNFLFNGQQIVLFGMKENTRFFSRSNCQRGPIYGINPNFKCKDILTWNVSVWESTGGILQTPKLNFHQTLSKLNLFILLEFFGKYIIEVVCIFATQLLKTQVISIWKVKSQGAKMIPNHYNIQCKRITSISIWKLHILFSQGLQCFP